MKKILTVLLTIIFFAVNVHAADKWDATEYSLGIATTLAIGIDYLQTANIIEESDGDCATHDDGSWHCSNGYYETNSYLGKDPSIGKINTYFAAYIFTTWVIADYLDEYRKPYLGMVFIYQLNVIYENDRIGLKATIKL